MHIYIYMYVLLYVRTDDVFARREYIFTEKSLARSRVKTTLQATAIPPNKPHIRIIITAYIHTLYICNYMHVSFMALFSRFRFLRCLATLCVDELALGSFRAFLRWVSGREDEAAWSRIHFLWCNL